MFWAYLLCVVLLAIEKVSCNYYCSLSACGLQEHTMCKYPTNEPGPECKNFDASGSKFSTKEKELIVETHNQYRDKVAWQKETTGVKGGQIGGSDMIELVWDEELAAIAERWSFQCKNDTDKCRALLNGVSSGQNVAIGEFQSRETDLVEFMKRWYSEVENHDGRWPHPFSPEEEKKCGRFTQMVWGATNRVGCGQSWFNDSSSGHKLAHLLVCNYAPSGNKMGATIYTAGRPCYMCPRDQYRCSQRYKHLCPNYKDSLSFARSKLEATSMSPKEKVERVHRHLFQDTYRSNPGGEPQGGGKKKSKKSGASRKFDGGLLLRLPTLALIVAHIYFVGM